MGKELILVIVLIVLVIISGFFSAAEIVYAKLNVLRLKKKKDNKSAMLAIKHSEDYPVLISTILIGNNLANTAASSLATVLFLSLYGSIGAVYAGVVMTIVLLVGSEIVPKIFFSKYPTTAAVLFAKPLRLCIIVFKPVVYVITKFIDLISPIWTFKKDEDEEDTSGEELINMIETIEEKGLIDNETKELVTSAIELKDVTAHEIMKHRVDIVSFNIDDGLEELIKDEDIFTYSRVVIYEDTIDNIIGILNTKKLIIELLKGNEVDLKSMLAKPIYVHKTKLLTSILKLFKETKTHIAIVVDEFGGTLGIITLEDVLEEVVGEIWDEMDEVEEEFVQTSTDEFIVDGDLNIYDMFELVDLEVDDDFECAYSTVAGFCTEMLDDFPKVGDTFEFENLEVTILEVTGFRVEKIKVIRKKDE